MGGPGLSEVSVCFVLVEKALLSLCGARTLLGGVVHTGDAVAHAQWVCEETQRATRPVGIGCQGDRHHGRCSARGNFCLCLFILFVCSLFVTEGHRFCVEDVCQKKQRCAVCGSRVRKAVSAETFVHKPKSFYSVVVQDNGQAKGKLVKSPGPLWSTVPG